MPVLAVGPERTTQVGALPFRTTADGHFEVLLVTSRGGRRWIIPKGWPVRGLEPHESAAREALEEAGLIGTVHPEPIGSFTHIKGVKGGTPLRCTVTVYPMQVESTRGWWRERGQRDLQWCSPEQALELVAEKSLRDVIVCLSNILAAENSSRD
jgi:8-oxo-dGTP pyrophosphatase MutT (NUDIX family)